jgi:hypothetical protein
LEHLFQVLPYFLMSEKFPPFELVETALYLVPKPNIVVETVLDELLHVLVCAARNIRGNAVNLGLQLRGKVYFHESRVRKVGTGVKGSRWLRQR